MTETHDTTRGFWRKIYAGALRGKRINRVSIGAELMFWHLHMLADDYGGFHADPELMGTDAFPRREEANNKECSRWIDELAEHGLVSLYEASGEHYGQIIGFEDRQPAISRNGKRVARVPVNPSASKVIQGHPSASKVILVHPESSKCVQGHPSASKANGDTTNTNTNRTKTRTKTKTTAAPVSDSGESSESISDSCSGERDKARARFQAVCALYVGRNNNTRHPAGSKQHAADLTCVGILFDRWWPEDCACEPPAFKTLMQTATAAKPKRKPLAWIQARMKEVQA